ncbi:MAG TPA: glycoside hydrolase family 140 protein [Verrucomicrobiae bacterium]|nr:glycoside hydrolase family 140 protein [Verrucomicrobiae bacterium]
MKRLVISDNRRFLTWEAGKPFFWLADTAWELFHRPSFEEADHYLENRRQKGFTVVQAVVLAEFDGLVTPNAYGERPLINNDPLKPNEAYFHHVDRLIHLAAQKGLFIGLVPTWGDKIELLGHGKGPLIFEPKNARAYGEWLGNRYRDTWNIIWINGGDRQGGGDNRAIWEAIAHGIKSADQNHLMTFHPLGGNGGHSSSEWFHQAPWLDFNLAQSGHERKHLGNDQIIARDYILLPTKPCLDGEPRYEDHPVNWKPQELGWFDDYDARQAAYWAVFAGAFGHTYGCHPVWQFFCQSYAPISFARRNWRQALDLPGACQMRHLRNLIESRPMLSRVPDQSILLEEKTGPEHRRACRGEGYILVYLPQGGTVTVTLESLCAAALQAWWYDPRTGDAIDGGCLPGVDRLEFTAPWAGPCSDWVLVIDSAEADFSPPGTLPDFEREATKPEPNQQS